MLKFADVWMACIIVGYALTPLGMIVTYFVFKHCERAYPEVFSLSHVSVTSFKKAWHYWAFVLMGKYKNLNNQSIKNQCTLLRIFFLVYVVVFAIAIIGIFIS